MPVESEQAKNGDIGGKKDEVAAVRPFRPEEKCHQEAAEIEQGLEDTCIVV